nr:disease resistance protein RPV1-like isoform X2 [Ziziphus jujuba var. spinosa]
MMINFREANPFLKNCWNLEAIKDSRCSVIVISENYADSTWCLDELFEIVKCRKDNKQIVLPIFYHVDPSHVRKQSGSIGEAFERDDQDFSDHLEKVQSWRDALKEVGNLAGWHLYDRVWMHDLLQEMGKEIVREKCCTEPGRRSRLWDNDDLYHVLENNTGTEQVEAIVCHFLKRKILSWEAFSSMKKLRLLIIDFGWGDTDCHTTKVEYSKELWFLEWFYFPSEDFPSGFQPDGLVELQLFGSNIKELWNNPIKPFHNLQLIDLRYSRNLSKFNDFRMVPNLEKLILQGCSKLLEVHPSIAFLERLTLLDLKYFTSLENLPASLDGLKSLKVLELEGC